MRRTVYYWKTSEKLLQATFAGFPFHALECIRLRKDIVRSLRALLGFVAPLDASSVVSHSFGRLCPVAYPKQLVGGTQMLLYG